MTTWRQQAVEGGSSDQKKRNFKKYSRLMSTAIRKLGEHPCITQSERGEGGGQPNAYVGKLRGRAYVMTVLMEKNAVLFGW